jgi:DNA-binding response OmpR family regulator
MTEKILVVEDEPTLLETLTYNLKREGYKVEGVSDGHAALAAAREQTPDLIVLDIMLPGIDGLEITRILRQEITIPILMLTARDSEIDRVLGLEIGADDYLTKPFSMRELMARVKALLRRVRIDQEKADSEPGRVVEKLEFDNLVINLTRLEVTLDEKVLQLKPKEYELLLYLARHRGQVMSRDNILERVWGWDFGGGSRTVDVHVRWLREKIEKDPANPTRIMTIRGVGYRFEG